MVIWMVMAMIMMIRIVVMMITVIRMVMMQCPARVGIESSRSESEKIISFTFSEKCKVKQKSGSLFSRSEK